MVNELIVLSVELRTRLRARRRAGGLGPGLGGGAMGVLYGVLKRTLIVALLACIPVAPGSATTIENAKQLLAQNAESDPDQISGTYHVLVNANNRYSAEDAEMTALVRRLYLRDEDAWPDGGSSLPLGRPAGSTAARAFAKLVLGMDQAELKAHWQARTPPPVISELQDLLPAIARNQGAFSVVAEGEIEKLPAKIRVLFTFSAPPAGPVVAGPTLLPPAKVEAYIGSHIENVRRELTDFNRRSDDDQVRKGQARLIHGFEVLGVSSGRYLVELSYTWKFFNIDRPRTDYLLVQLADEDFQIVGRVASPGDLTLGSAQTAALTTGANYEGRWQATIKCTVETRVKPFEVDITNGEMSARGLRGIFSGSVDKSGAAEVTVQASQTTVANKDNWILASFTGNFTESGLTVRAPGRTNWQPVGVCTLTLIRPAPLHSREEVEAYFEKNRTQMREKLSDYNLKHRVFLWACVDCGLVKVIDINSYTIKSLNGNRVFLHIIYTINNASGFSSLGNQGDTVAGNANFEMQWVDGELEFVGHTKS